MAANKHSSSGDSSGDGKRAKRQMAYATFEKWQKQFNIDYQSFSWLRCNKEKNDKDVVSTLWCEICWQYKSNICSIKNYSKSWIENHKTSNVVDHATSAQHKAAMNFLKIDQAKDKGKPLATIAPIVNSLLKLNASTHDRL